MVYTVNSCCCGCSLRTATLIIGVLQAVLSGLLLVAIVVLLATQGKHMFNHVEHYYIWIGVLVVVWILMAYQMGFAILLICAVKEEDPGLVKLWIIYTIVCLNLNLIGSAVLAVSDRSDNGLKSMGSAIIGSVLSIYFIIVVNSYRSQLTQMAKRRRANNGFI